MTTTNWLPLVFDNGPSTSMLIHSVGPPAGKSFSCCVCIFFACCMHSCPNQAPLCIHRSSCVINTLRLAFCRTCCVFLCVQLVQDSDTCINGRIIVIMTVLSISLHRLIQYKLKVYCTIGRSQNPVFQLLMQIDNEVSSWPARQKSGL